MRPFPLAVTAACVTAAAVLAAGCGSTADAPGATSASRPDSAPPTAPCNADYCDPLDWATAQASTPPRPGREVVAGQAGPNPF